MTTVTLNGSQYSDDGSASRDMRGGGHESWLLPMLSDTMTEVAAAASSAIDAAASASSASDHATNASNYAAALNATSTSSVTIGEPETQYLADRIAKGVSALSELYAVVAQSVDDSMYSEYR